MGFGNGGTGRHGASPSWAENYTEFCLARISSREKLLLHLRWLTESGSYWAAALYVSKKIIGNRLCSVLCAQEAHDIGFGESCEGKKRIQFCYGSQLVGLVAQGRGSHEWGQDKGLTSGGLRGASWGVLGPDAACAAATGPCVDATFSR
jgi:hypothetical protein